MNASSPAASGSVDKDGVEDESESYSFVRKWGSEEQMTVNFSEPMMLILTLQKNISLLWIEMVIVSKCSIRMGHFFLSGVQKVLMIANLMYPTAWMLMLMVMFGSLIEVTIVFKNLIWTEISFSSLDPLVIFWQDLPLLPELDRKRNTLNTAFLFFDLYDSE
jgi:hypothetical protein